MREPGRHFTESARKKPATESGQRQRGTALIVCLLMMLAVLMLGTSCAQIALQEEKASRHDRDRFVAMEAAEAALKDAELDVERSGRVERFLQQPMKSPDGSCEAGVGNPLLGLCHPSPPELYPVWQKIDLMRGERVASVPTGFFTRRSLAADESRVSASAARYIIEVLPGAEEAAPGSNAIFRITAIGYGKGEGKQVVVQAYYRKFRPGTNASRTGRLGWREILNWEELRDARGLDQE